MQDDSSPLDGPARPTLGSVPTEGSGLTSPIDITDPRLVKAIAHPLRLRILSVLNDRVASPSEIAEELGSPLSNTSYHVRQLASLGFLQLVDRTARRGAIEHYYTATVRPTITDDAWARVPKILKRAMVSGGLQQGVAHIAAAAEAGGFDRDDAHYSRTSGRLDAEGWRAAASELSALLDRLDAIFGESASRLLVTDAPGEDATVVLMQFAGPPRAPATRGSGDQAPNELAPGERPVRFVDDP
jgi:DNA-binding transcriptional ArsR family regulator